MPDGRKAVAKSWERIEASLTKALPEEYLPEGAKEADLERAERVLGVTFPKQLRDLYRCHDGTNRLFICNYYLMPLIAGGPYKRKRKLTVQSVVDCWSAMTTMLQTGTAGEYSASKPSSRVKPVWWNAKWIPVGDNEQGDLICVDMDPAKGGKKGQVFDWWHETAQATLLAEDVGTWFAQVAAGLEKGDITPVA